MNEINKQMDEMARKLQHEAEELRVSVANY